MRKDRKAFHADRVEAGSRQVETTAPRKTYRRNADTKNMSNSTADVIQMERKSRKS